MKDPGSRMVGSTSILSDEFGDGFFCLGNGFFERVVHDHPVELRGMGDLLLGLGHPLFDRFGRVGSPADDLPPGVWEYIKENGLYGYAR